MATPAASFRAGLLDGRAIAVAGAGGDAATAAAALCGELGADVVAVAADAADEAAMEAAFDRVLGTRPSLDTVVVDAAGLFATAGGGVESVRAALDGAWLALRAAAVGGMIGHGGGKVVLLGPLEGAGPYAGAVRAGLENMARTLSIEWSRHEVTLTAVLPGSAATADDAAGLVAYLASPAGDYFSGCTLEPS